MLHPNVALLGGLLALVQQPVAPPPDAEPVPANDAAYARLKPSLFTVEVVPVAGEDKRSLGSAYVAGTGGRLITNYHVVGAYIEAPERYRLRVRSDTRTFDARLRSFDLINDLAVLEAPIDAPALRLAPEPGSPGSHVIAFGNPSGLGLSLIEGVFNGLAAHGFVDRLLLSMPLNAGMSGGPILNDRREVIGTNVSVSWRENSLSFGVPAAKAIALLEKPPLETTKTALLAETNRQLAELDRLVDARVVEPFLAGNGQPVNVGRTRMPHLPEAFECWNDSQEHEKEQLTKTSYRCNLQFTPSLESVEEVGSIEILAEHFTTRTAPYGFYGMLAAHAESHHGIEAREPGNGMMSPPKCVSDRVRGSALTWKVSTCVYGYDKYPGFGYFSLVATSLVAPREAAFVAVYGRGVTLEPFVKISRRLLDQVRLEPQP